VVIGCAFWRAFIYPPGGAFQVEIVAPFLRETDTERRRCAAAARGRRRWRRAAAGSAPVAALRRVGIGTAARGRNRRRRGGAGPGSARRTRLQRGCGDSARRRAAARGRNRRRHRSGRGSGAGAAAALACVSGGSTCHAWRPFMLRAVHGSGLTQSAVYPARPSRHILSPPGPKVPVTGRRGGRRAGVSVRSVRFAL
jgi:hypothetical protein